VTPVALGSGDAESLQRCVAGGGVAVFPTDTVYGVCCDPDSEQAARRMYALKGRPSRRSSAILFFSLEPVLDMLRDLRDRERDALQALLPGPVTVLLANREQRFAAACRRDPDTLGLRVPRLPEGIAALGALARPVMQTSANLSGQPDAKSLQEVPPQLLDQVDLVLDGGELPGVPSTVVDLRDFDAEGRWYILREGALGGEAVQELLAPL
jgi:L-threonylcarbamoyladenylate synthase